MVKGGEGEGRTAKDLRDTQIRKEKGHIDPVGVSQAQSALL